MNPLLILKKKNVKPRLLLQEKINKNDENARGPNTIFQHPHPTHIICIYKKVFKQMVYLPWTSLNDQAKDSEYSNKH